MIVQNFGTKFLLRRGECKIRENSNFRKKGKTVILVKTQNFSRSRMTKQISPLESSWENLTTTSNFFEFRDCRNFTFFEAPGVGCHKTGLRDM